MLVTAAHNLNTHYRLLLRRRCCTFLRQGHPNASCAALSDLSHDHWIITGDGAAAHARDRASANR
jgi:hypothetical protein